MVDFAQKAYESSYQTLEDGGVTRRVTNRDSFRQFMKTCYSDEEIDYAISYMGYDFYTNYYNFAYDMIYNSNNVTNEDNIRFWLSEYGATSNEIDSIISSLGKTTATDQTYRDAYILYNDGITNKNDFYLNMHNWGHGDAEIEEAVNALGIILSE